MDFNSIDIKVKNLMYNLYWGLPKRAHFNDKYIDSGGRDNWIDKCPEEAEIYYKIVNIQFRKEKINKIYDRISNR